jgi:hypothetical protein
MQKADLFAYLAAFVSIIVAVAVTDMIQSTHRLIRARDKVKWDPLTPLLALSIFLGLLATFFSLWGDARFDRLTYYGLVAFMAQPTLVALTAFAVLPDEVPENDLDLRKFYFENRRYIAVVAALIAVLDIIWAIRWAVIMNALNRPDFWWHFAPVTVVNAILLVVIYVSERWRVQLVAVVLNLALGHFGYGGWYIETIPGK